LYDYSQQINWMKKNPTKKDKDFFDQQEYNKKKSVFHNVLNLKLQES